MPPPKLRVFWDLDSCRPPTTYSTPWEVIDSVRLFTSNFGIATDIRAYWDSNKSIVDRASESLRAAMPSMGVNLVDCSLTRGYTEDALTRRLTVDVLILAIDESVATNTDVQDIIVILSGDESILYPVSLLMFRNYTIFLVVPDDNSNVQPCPATRIFNWQRDVLGTRIEEPTFAPEAMATPETMATPEAVPSPDPGAMQTREWIVYGKHVPQRSATLNTSTRRSGSRSITAPGPPITPHAPSAPSQNSAKADELEWRSRRARDTLAEAPGYRVPISPPTPPPLDSKEGTRRSSHGGWDANGQWYAGGWDVEPESGPSSTPKSTPNNAKSPDPGCDSEGNVDVMEARIGYPSPPPKEVPLSVFDPLVQILRETKRRTMGRSKLGEEMARHKSVYKEAGVKNFNDYIALAVTKDLVVAGGRDNNLYVKLHPKLKKNEAG